MTITCIDRRKYLVHFWKFCDLQRNAIYHTGNDCFVEFNRQQIGLLLMAYNEKEFERFEKFLLKKEFGNGRQNSNNENS